MTTTNTTATQATFPKSMCGRSTEQRRLRRAWRLAHGVQYNKETANMSVEERAILVTLRTFLKGDAFN